MNACTRIEAANNLISSALQTRAGIHFAREWGDTTFMPHYNFAFQIRNDVWSKIDYDELDQTGLTNQGEYGMVCLGIRGEGPRFVN